MQLIGLKPGTYSVSDPPAEAGGNLGNRWSTRVFPAAKIPRIVGLKLRLSGLRIANLWNNIGLFALQVKLLGLQLELFRLRMELLGLQLELFRLRLKLFGRREKLFALRTELADSAGFSVRHAREPLSLSTFCRSVVEFKPDDFTNTSHLGGLATIRGALAIGIIPIGPTLIHFDKVSNAVKSAPIALSFRAFWELEKAFLHDVLSKRIPAGLWVFKHHPLHLGCFKVLVCREVLAFPCSISTAENHALERRESKSAPNSYF
jgi:hypothetical protein